MSSFLAGLVRNQVFSAVHLALTKRRINQFKPVQQSRQQVLRAYCPNIYAVSGAVGVSGRDWHDQGQVLCHPIAKIVIV